MRGVGKLVDLLLLKSRAVLNLLGLIHQRTSINGSEDTIKSAEWCEMRFILQNWLLPFPHSNKSKIYTVVSSPTTLNAITLYTEVSQDRTVSRICRSYHTHTTLLSLSI